MSPTAQSALQDALLRMIVPMRREFGCELNLARMRQDYAYASAIVTEAMTSATPRLRESARVVEQHWRAVFAEALAAPEPAARAETAGALKRRAADAARRLIELIGPVGESLAIRLERVKDAPALARLIDESCRSVANIRGEAAALAFRRQVADPGDASGSAGPAEARRADRSA